MVTGQRWSDLVQVVNIANGKMLWMTRQWLLSCTELAFDARTLVDG